MEQDLIHELENRINQLTRLQKCVAAYILKDPMQAAFSTVDELAHAAGTSTTTVIRLALFLGYSGYADFQKSLQEYLMQQASPSRKLELNTPYQKHRGEIDDIVVEITKMQIDNINKTFHALSNDQLMKTEALVTNAQHIYTCGSRSCSAMAYHLSHNLDQMYGKSNYITPNVGEIAETLRRITDKDVVIVITMARYNQFVLDVARLAKEKGASIIAVTDSYRSPLTEYANIIYIAECRSAGFHNAMVAASFLTEVIVGVCTMKNPELIKQNLKQSEKYLSALGIMSQK